MRITCHAEIQYGQVHSDICPPSCDVGEMDNANWREFLHQNLDEFLDKAQGAGDQFHVTLMKEDF